MKHLVVVSVVLFATVAFALTDRDKLEGQIDKHATEGLLSGPAKTVCVCQDGGVNNGRAGWVRYFVGPGNGFAVACGVAGFATDESQNSETRCEIFNTLAR